jgi:mannose-6-phosphate isomerase
MVYRDDVKTNIFLPVSSKNIVFSALFDPVLLSGAHKIFGITIIQVSSRFHFDEYQQIIVEQSYDVDLTTTVTIVALDDFKSFFYQVRNRQIFPIFARCFVIYQIISDILELYPLTFRTIYKDKIWGGEKINSFLGKDFSPLPNCGETWEVSGVEGNISVVAQGRLEGKLLTELISTYKGDLVGDKVFDQFGTEFPLLIKFIDANQDLSIQVHPDDTLAKKRHNSFGKTEMWYVMQADEGSSLISGFNQPLDKEKYLEKFNAGQLTDILNREEVQDHDVFFLPAGRVHTIGKGLLIAEIQQTSDITYRIYDFDRMDASGNKRELHVEEALDAIDYHYYEDYKTGYTEKPNHRNELVNCQYFITNKLTLDTAFDASLSVDSFRIYLCLEGDTAIITDSGTLRLTKGDVTLVPASLGKVEFEPSGSVTLLETYVP